MKSKNILFDIVAVAWHLCWANNKLNKFNLFYLFVKFRLQSFYLKKFQKLTNEVSMFGLQIHVLNFESFLYSFKEIFICDIYQFKTNSLAPIIIDAGSNIGLSVIYFKLLYPNAKITTFEPDFENFKYLELNTKALANITLHQKALSNEVGEKLFYRNLLSGNLQGSFVKNDNSNSNIILETDILSSYINNEVDLLKIDVEGSEFQVVSELINRSKQKYIKSVIVEYHQIKTENSDLELQNFIDLFENNSFQCVQKQFDILNKKFQSQDIVLRFENQNA